MILRTDTGIDNIAQACRVLGVSRASVYVAKSGRKRPCKGRTAPRSTPVRYASTQALREAIEHITGRHPSWGIRKVWASLRRAPYELRAGRRRIGVLMKDMGLCAEPCRTRRHRLGEGHVIVPDSNRRWATDMTTVPTSHDGLVAIVPVIDCGDRALLALRATKSQEAAAVLAPVLEAVEVAFGSPGNVPPGLELRTDNGPQYTGYLAEDLCDRWHLQHTFAPIATPTGNAVAERLIRTLKEELIWLRDWTSLEELQRELDAWLLEYNLDRPHQALHWLTPAERRAHNTGLGLKRAA